MKKKIACLALSLSLLSGSFAFGAEGTLAYRLSDLRNLAVKDNAEVDAINAEAEKALIQYDDMIEDYEDLEETIETIKKNLDRRREETEQSKEEYDSAGGSFLNRGKTYEIYKTNVQIEENVEEQYKRLITQQAQTKKQMDSLILLAENAESKRVREIEVLKLQVQKDYYTLVLLDQQIKLLEDQLSIVEANIKNEEARKKLNLTTDFAIDSLKTQKNALDLSLRSLKENYQILTDALKVKVGIDRSKDVEFVLEAPVYFSLQKFELDQVMQSFNENNLDMLTLKQNFEIQEELISDMELAFEDDDSEYKLALIQLDADKLSLTNYEQSTEQYIKNLVAQFEKLKEDVLQQLESRKLSDETLRQAQVQYDIGLISALQLQSKKLDHSQTLYDSNEVFVNLTNTRRQLDLALQGMMVN